MGRARGRERGKEGVPVQEFDGDEVMLVGVVAVTGTEAGGT